MHSERTVTLTWKALLSMCSPSFAPSKFTIICLPYKFLRVWKCLLTEEKFHSHHLACRKWTATPAILSEMLQIFNINFIHAFQRSIQRHKQAPGSSQLCRIPLSYRQSLPFGITYPISVMQQNLSEVCSAITKALDVFHLSKAGAFASKPLDILTRWDPTYDTEITLSWHFE